MKKQNILVVVDYQNDFVNGVLAIKDAETIAQNIQKEINNPKYNHIVYTFDTHEQTEYNISQEKELFPLHCEYNTTGWNLFEIIPNENDRFKAFLKEYHPTEPFLSFTLDKETFFCKNKFDIFEGNKFYETWLTASFDPADTVITVVGVATEYCVNFHVQGLINRGYTVEILENCVKAIDDNIGKQTLKGFKEVMQNNVNEKNVVAEFVEMIQAEYIMNDLKRKEIILKIRDFVKNYVKNNNLKSLVVGVSGGLDSAVVAALCQEKYTGVPLIGLSIPISSTNTHKEQAQWVGSNYCTVFEEFTAWDEEYKNVFNTVSLTNKIANDAGFKAETFPVNILQGNVKARLRMITLYDLARKTNGLVLSTDQFSEESAGFWSICGDVGDLSPIQKIWKGFELWQIAEELGIRADIITQAPSDGLGVTTENTDEAQLGMNYPTFDAMMSIYFKENNLYLQNELNLFFDQNKKLIDTIKETKVFDIAVKRYLSTQFKRNGSVIIPRTNLF